jgi:hypothetical protein
MATDNEGGAASAMHVNSPPGAVPTQKVAADGIGDRVDEDYSGALPAASGQDGSVDMRQTVAVQSDKLEH